MKCKAKLKINQRKICTHTINNQINPLNELKFWTIVSNEYKSTDLDIKFDNNKYTNLKTLSKLLIRKVKKKKMSMHLRTMLVM